MKVFFLALVSDLHLFSAKLMFYETNFWGKQKSLCSYSWLHKCFFFGEYYSCQAFENSAAILLFGLVC